MRGRGGCANDVWCGEEAVRMREYLWGLFLGDCNEGPSRRATTLPSRAAITINLERGSKRISTPSAPSAQGGGPCLLESGMLQRGDRNLSRHSNCPIYYKARRC